MFETVKIAKALPDGFQASPLLPEHQQGAVDVLNTYFRWMNQGGDVTSLDEMRVEWQEEGFNPETDTCVVLAPDGRVVGYNDVWSVNTFNVRMYSWIGVLPEMLDNGVADHLVEWGIERSRQNVALAPEGARVVLHMSSNATCGEACRMLSRNGLALVRHSYRMHIDFHEPPAPAALPEGIAIRPMVVGKEERDTGYAVYESFLDHWGFVEEPFEKFLHRWQSQIEVDPYYDPSLFFVAVEGDQVAGISLCWPGIPEDRELGWVGTLGVRRPWRKRGLGLALLQHSFSELYKRGFGKAGLGVDAENITGAVRLYEKAGMHAARKNCMYELELRPGKDLMRQNP